MNNIRERINGVGKEEENAISSDNAVVIKKGQFVQEITHLENVFKVSTQSKFQAN